MPYFDLTGMKTKLQIHNNTYGDNVCWICEKKFKHKIPKFKETSDLQPFDIKPWCSPCLKLSSKIQKKQAELLDLEWEQFNNKFGIKA